MRPYLTPSPPSSISSSPPTAQAVNILGFPRKTCFQDNYVANCVDIAPSTCCVRHGSMDPYMSSGLGQTRSSPIGTS